MEVVLPHLLHLRIAIRFSAEHVVKDDRELNYHSLESVKKSTGSAREGVESQAGLARKMLLAQVLGESGDATNKEPMYKNKYF